MSSIGPLWACLATGAGTLYIERASRRDAMRVVHHMADRLRAHEILAVFPEGTTGDGAEVLPFHANLLQAAISAAAPVAGRGLALCRRGKRCQQLGALLCGRRLLGGFGLAHLGVPSRCAWTCTLAQCGPRRGATGALGLADLRAEIVHMRQLHRAA